MALPLPITASISIAIALAFFVVLIKIAWHLGTIAGALRDEEVVREFARHLNAEADGGR